MSLQSCTSIGVICIGPHEGPLTAFSFPSLSTCVMASMSGLQSKSFTSLFFAWSNGVPRMIDTVVMMRVFAILFKNMLLVFQMP